MRVMIDGVRYVPENIINVSLMNGTRCPKCDFVVSQVLDTRYSDKYRSTRRRRKCLSCGYRWTTLEIIHEDRSK